ncbi:uncharacterized protein [Musca autumnalis]|uniref:uncharacterized protein n=1 Tax=Musca autumnalis TaxID=221902 RepID=UPI003CF08ADA
MASSDFNKISSHCDVIIKIFKFLDTRDQVMLATVNNTLRRIFLDMVCPINYETLIIKRFHRLIHANYIVSNNNCTNRHTVYGDDGLLKFLGCWGEIVHELTTDNPVPMNYFPNLIKLNCEFERLIAEDITQLVVNLPNLEDLEISAQKCKKTGDYMSADIIQELLRLTNLKRLELSTSDDSCNITFKDFREIVTKLQLDILELKVGILPESNELEPLLPPPSLKHLAVTVDTENPGTFLNVLKNFDNLKTLEIEFVGEEMEPITNEFGALTQLKNLSIFNTEFPYSTRSLILPPNLATLRLIDCQNLTFDALQEFLDENSQPQLTELFAMGTSFRIREFKELKISSKIKNLFIKNFDLEQFRSPFVTNSALEQLELCNSHNLRIDALDSIRLSSLTFCQKLHTLDVFGQYLSLDTLLCLTNLKKLSIYVPVPEQWLYITRILQELSSLRELKVHQVLHRPGPYPPLPPAVVTNVVDLKVKTPRPDTSFTYDFWLDMFSLNPQLELKMNISLYGRKRLRDFIECEKFPKDLKKIIIHGFTKDVDEVKRDSKSVYDDIHYFTDLNEYEVLDPDEYNIIMSRNIK